MRPATVVPLVHLMNAHAPYLVGGPPSRFGSRDVDAYDTELLLADREVGRFLDELSTLEGAGRTVVIVGSDHGEAFGEHGDRYHASSVYQEQSSLRVVHSGAGGRGARGRGPDISRRPRPDHAQSGGHPRPAADAGPEFGTAASMGGAFRRDRLLYSEVLPDGHFVFDQKMVRRGDLKLILVGAREPVSAIRL